MSEMRTQLVETATALLSVGTATPEAFAEAGFGQLLVSEADGGFGGDWGDAVEVLRLVGFYQPRLDVAGLMVGDDRPTRPRIPELVEACPERLQGSRRGLPSSQSKTQDRGSPSTSSGMREGPNGSEWHERALATTALIGGALQRALELSIEHANTRVQFGKPLGKQQAVQQALALMAEEVAAVAVASQAAAKARDSGDAAFEIGCAKLRANKAAGTGGAIAHQVHGAIGFTQDYPLHHYTAKLVEWRSAYGHDAYWAEQIGQFALRFSGLELWQELTRRSDMGDTNS